MAIVLMAIAGAGQCESAGLVQNDIFVAGRDGYHTYRIPSLITTKAGTLLAFCEGRKNSKSDSGNIDLLVKRSEDGGETWSKQQVIWDDGENTCGNPCPVIDQESGTIWLLMTHNIGTDTEAAIASRTARAGRTVWICHSDDDGKTWSPLKEITSSVKDPSWGWGWYATGPGIGIQIQHGEFVGRLVIPCDHNWDAKKDSHASHVIYSDDHGATWKLGGIVRPHMNECQVVELAKGTLLLDMRSYLGEKRRAQSSSADGGLTWSPPRSHPELIEPVCQASILRYTWPNEHGKSRILFSNPASDKRRNVTVRLSYNEGKTWPMAKMLHAGPAAYSCLATLPNGQIACLYERGEKDAYEKITFALFSLEWLTDGKDRFKNASAKAPGN